MWTAYNWYKGNSYSLIQVNTEFPIAIDWALNLACHEGYPGHHVYNALLEQHLVRERKWVEYTVYPLYSPQSLIAEGSAEYGIELAFPAPERLDFEKKVLYPLAGLDPNEAERYAAVRTLVEQLNYGSNEAARRYLDGKISREAAIDWLVRHALNTPEKAAQRLRFIEQNRAYVINYNLGKDLVKRYIESKARPGDRWREFLKLLSSPRLPSGLE